MSSLQCHGVCKSHVSLEMMLHSFAPIPGFAHSHAVKLSEPVLARIEELKEKTSNVKQPGLRVLLYNLFFYGLVVNLSFFFFLLEPYRSYHLYFFWPIIWDQALMSLA